MIIQNVQTRRDFRKFIQFPYHFYRDDPNWIAPPPLGAVGAVRPSEKPHT
jgi:hypothetical protein